MQRRGYLKNLIWGHNPHYLLSREYIRIFTYIVQAWNAYIKRRMRQHFMLLYLGGNIKVAFPSGFWIFKPHLMEKEKESHLVILTTLNLKQTWRRLPCNSLSEHQNQEVLQLLRFYWWSHWLRISMWTLFLSWIPVMIQMYSIQINSTKQKRVDNHSFSGGNIWTFYYLFFPFTLYI